ncbi:carbonic anhydrase 2 isoform X2 [Zeugodacus cucurbitae]|uniref:Carbonic anhydrase n=1 Tax=Zeugodacus cucurbitae TaxID=28588 RepID=A0A0A1XBZ5_ZEUCU|nr:carbonic anhydrase 2 isoform X2 [Zeugodacus cucurbitae]
MHFFEFFKLCQRLIFFLPLTTANSPDKTTAPSSGGGWSYDNPEEWPVNNPQCGGDRQSPIAINTDKTVNADIPPITFASYDVVLGNYVVLENNGHTIKFNVPQTIENVPPTITNGPLEDIYEAAEVHFHWGSPTSKGSEHVINQRRYDVEMHIVHMNNKYGSVEEAREYEDGLSVIGVLFKVEKTVANHEQPGLSTIFNTVPYVTRYNSSASTQQLISLGSLLSNINRDKFYTYQGSLTTPPCSEAVTWIVYPEVVPISIFQVKNFWFVRDSEGGRLVNNYRPVQPIGSRDVYYRSSNGDEVNYYF